MILVNKPAGAPQRLASGAALTQANCQAYEAEPQSYLRGALKFEFKNTVYGHASVKRVLQKAQHDKCCYCEGHFAGNAPGDIEHYRPKDGAQQGRGDKAQYPGYYWLAYKWSNLYFSCPDCNRVAKRRLFPLANPHQRARYHADDVSVEQPLILDPGGPANPRDHIRFVQERPSGITPRGKATVEFVKLDREELNERRRSRLRELERLRDIVALLQKDQRPAAHAAVTDAFAELAKAVLPKSIFSAMAQDFLQ
jgi:uncharacterized protein (TIGR02646 family)